MTCPVTMPGLDRSTYRGSHPVLCGQPIDRDGLCKKHADDKARILAADQERAEKAAERYADYWGTNS